MLGFVMRLNCVQLLMGCLGLYIVPSVCALGQKAGSRLAHAPSIEHHLAQIAEPLEATNILMASNQMKQFGVCRLNNLVSEEMCSTFRDHITSLQQGPMDDLRNIVGTRLRFEEAVLVSLNKRTDYLLPVEDSTVNQVLTSLIETLGGVLEEAASILPGANAGKQFQNVELVEVGCLVSEPGATHQSLHADFRRDASNLDTKLPPRLVTFLYLQDVPTLEHGPTIFLPKTNNEESHLSFASSEREAEVGDQNLVNMATLDCGDVAIYDASLLHFGSSNSVPHNIRAVFYFGVSLKGAAALCSAGSGESLTMLKNMQPICMKTAESGETRYLYHKSVKGMQ